MRILVVGDLHGQIPKIYFKKFDAIICIGDICLDTDIKKYLLKSLKEFLKNYKNKKNWWDIVGKKTAKRYIDKSLKSGRAILERLNSYNVPVYIIPGNWDYAEKDEEWSYLNKNYYHDVMIKGLKNIKDVHSKIFRIKEYNIIGYGIVNGPELLKYRHYNNISKEQYKKNTINYKKLIKKYNRLFKRAKHPIIFLSHNIPFNTKLDKIVNKGNPMNGLHYGSNLARDVILKHKPLICIGGHMHEHYGTCKIGRTIVLNAGFGGEKNTLIELENGKIKSIKFHGKTC